MCWCGCKASNCCWCRLFAQLSFTVADRAEFHIMQFIKLPSTSDRLARSSSRNVKRDSILPLDLLKGTDSDVKCYLANCLHSVHVTIPSFSYWIRCSWRLSNQLIVWPVWFNGRAFARDPKRSWVRISAGLLPGNSLGQAAHTHVPLSPSSIIRYRPMGSDALRLGR